MINTLNIIDGNSKGKITFLNDKKSSKKIKVVITLDGYGFTVDVTKKDLKELLG